MSESASPTCRLVRAGDEFQGKQGLFYAPAISAESVGAKGIHLQFVTLPPGAKANAHKHAAHETAIYVLSGVSGMWFGEKLESHFIVKAGDFLYIPADTPHLPYNPSKTENCIAIIARTDPNEQESVVLLPHLDALHAELPEVRELEDLWRAGDDGCQTTETMSFEEMNRAKAERRWG